jgi:ring-1,2-phenylacetyl-CoA epoxidase subunit PaaA
VRAIEGIFKEEKMHIRHGELWVQRLTASDATRAEAQDALEKWYVRTMNIFGRPNSPKNRLYQKFRLKTRDNDEVRRTFAAEIKTLAAAAGLRVPEWQPVWDKLPEEAQIPG